MLHCDHILITGAGGAIGGELARVFARTYPQARLTLVDRNETTTRQLAHELGARAEVRLWDLATVDSLAAAWTELVAARGPVDVLVNCAGIMEVVSFTGSGWAMGSRMLAINLLSPLRLMDLAVPAMIARGGGGVINISSMAGRVPIRGCSYYGATKAGIGMASEIARLELGKQGVRVVTVYPGPVHSGLESHARAQVSEGFIAKYIPTGEPEGIAPLIVAALQRGKARVIYPFPYGLANKVVNVSSAFTSWFSPQPKG